ncbi:TlpA disulfide reductase family protein [Lacinutrix algicola]|uniref:TlpA disulfide reductase family protein n=1 Tax=Lacinutrix algicola TaxID=342954 RepID=UPI0006E1D735|nr:TlpA disulfide reductase family protein [Lacinutrix algicola]
MKLYIILLMVCFSACKQGNDSKVESEPIVKTEESSIEEIELNVYNFNELEPLLNIKDDKIYVINFWATWCAPCVKELPYFETLNETYKSKNVEVILVSLDFPKQYDTKLKPFMVKHKLESKIVALDDVDSNTWIPKVDKNWSGAIPRTIIYNKRKRIYFSLFNR